MLRSLAIATFALVLLGGVVHASDYETVASGFQFTEGPVWLPSGELLFSDIPANKIYALKNGKTRVFCENSSNSNGLTLDLQGRLIACEHSSRRVTRTEADGSIAVLASHYNGKRLNSPNDVVVKSDGSIYFTDPTYGIQPDQQELDFQGVYRIKLDGELELLADDFKMPNGLCFSPDESKLYIADSSELRHIRVFDVAEDGTLQNGKIFAEVGDGGLPDGMKVDLVGNLYVAGPGGVWVFDSTGKNVEKIELPKSPANLAWGGKWGQTLYATTVDAVYAIEHAPGGRLPYIVPKDKRRLMLSCDTYSLRDYFKSGKIDYLTAPALYKELGIPGITYNEIWMKSYNKDYLDSIKEACADAGLTITGFIIEGNMATLDDRARRNQIESNKMKMKAAAYLGAPIVRINLGGLGDAEKDNTIGAQRCIDAFNELIPLAKKLNLKMTIENHGGVSKTADTILKVIKGSDPDWVGSCLDFGNWPDDIRYTESAKLAPYAYHVHAKTHKFNAQGEDTNKDYNRLLKMLKDTGYNYAVSIEYEGPDDQIEGVKNTVALLLKYWPELAR